MPYFCIKTKRKIHLGDCDNCIFKKGVGTSCIYLKVKIRGRTYYFSSEGKDYEKRRNERYWKQHVT